MTLAECREIVDMYDGAASSEQRQLTALLARLDDIAADLRRRQADLRRTLAEVERRRRAVPADGWRTSDVTYAIGSCGAAG